MTSAQPRLSAAAYRAGPGRPKERTVQVPLIAWVRANVSALSWHSKNEGQRSDLGRIRDAAEGVLKGTPDIVGVVEYGPRASQLFAIEVKRPGSTASDVEREQRRFGHMLVERGGLWTWVDSVEAAQTWCRAQGIVRPSGWIAPWTRAGEEYDL